MERFCQVNLGLDVLSSKMLGCAVDTLREDVCHIMPSWRVRSPKNQAALLARFVLDAVACRTKLLPCLDNEPMEFEKFLQVVGCLGEEWSQEDLEDVALLSEEVAATCPP